MDMRGIKGYLDWLDSEEICKLKSEDRQSFLEAIEPVNKELLSEGFYDWVCNIVDLEPYIYKKVIALSVNCYDSFFYYENGQIVSKSGELSHVAESLYDMCNKLSNFKYPLIKVSFEVGFNKLFSEVVLKKSNIPEEYVVIVRKRKGFKGFTINDKGINITK